MSAAQVAALPAHTHNVIVLPTAAPSPVSNIQRKGRLPKGVVSLRMWRIAHGKWALLLAEQRANEIEMLERELADCGKTVMACAYRITELNKLLEQKRGQA